MLQKCKKIIFKRIVINPIFITRAWLIQATLTGCMMEFLQLTATAGFLLT
jgi:hypothetical protein